MDDLNSVLESMIAEINDMHKRNRPAPDHQLRAIEACLMWLEENQNGNKTGLQLAH